LTVTQIDATIDQWGKYVAPSPCEWRMKSPETVGELLYNQDNPQANRQDRPGASETVMGRAC